MCNAGTSPTLCQSGCRGTNGNGCPAGQVCTSTDATIGTCIFGSDGGAGGTGGTGGTGGVADAGSDVVTDAPNVCEVTDGGTACDACFSTSCCAEITACLANADCAAAAATFSDCTGQADASVTDCASLDAALAKRLYEVSAALTGVEPLPC